MEITPPEYQRKHSRVPPVVCEFSSLQISCESDFYMPEFKSCHHIPSAIRWLLCVSHEVAPLSRSVIVHLQWQYLK